MLAVSKHLGKHLYTSDEVVHQKDSNGHGTSGHDSNDPDNNGRETEVTAVNSGDHSEVGTAGVSNSL
jgi:hypothetical protein